MLHACPPFIPPCPNGSDTRLHGAARQRPWSTIVCPECLSSFRGYGQDGRELAQFSVIVDAKQRRWGKGRRREQEEQRAAWVECLVFLLRGGQAKSKGERRGGRGRVVCVVVQRNVEHRCLYTFDSLFPPAEYRKRCTLAAARVGALVLASHRRHLCRGISYRIAVYSPVLPQ